MFFLWPARKRSRRRGKSAQPGRRSPQVISRSSGLRCGRGPPWWGSGSFIGCTTALPRPCRVRAGGRHLEALGSRGQPGHALGHQSDVVGAPDEAGHCQEVFRADRGPRLHSRGAQPVQHGLHGCCGVGHDPWPPAHLVDVQFGRTAVVDGDEAGPPVAARTTRPAIVRGGPRETGRERGRRFVAVSCFGQRCPFGQRFEAAGPRRTSCHPVRRSPR